jgi:hypothetical protein
VSALTARHLNRATLERQMLLERQSVAVDDAIGRLVGLQAQEPAAPYVALWNRIDGFDPASLDAAFADGSIVKASLMRITLHAVRREDYTTFHEAMVASLRASRLNDMRFRSTDLTVEQADELLPLVLGFASEPRTRDEIEAMLTDHLGEPIEPRLWWAYRTFAPVVHVPGDDVWSFGREQRFRTAPTEPNRDLADASLQRLAQRYLAAFGPASPIDFAQFTMRTRASAREAFDALDLIELEGPDGALFDLPDHSIPDEDTPAPPRLLGMWESTLLAYADRSRVLPEEYRREVIRTNGDVLPTVWVDGYVAGVWRATADGVEVCAFGTIAEAAWGEIEREARVLGETILAHDPVVFGRYDHWWGKITTGERRILEV